MPLGADASRVGPTMSGQWTTRERVHLLFLIADQTDCPNAEKLMSELRREILDDELSAQQRRAAGQPAAGDWGWAAS